MRTVTYDETQWKLVPLYIEENQVDKGVMGYLGCTADELKKIDPEQLTRCEQLIINAYVDCVNAAPPYPYQSGEVNEMVWMPLTSAGQVKKGTKLRFKIGDKTYHEKAKLILRPGTLYEEVIYNIKQNYYLITSMVISGHSSAKGVRIMKQFKIHFVHNKKGVISQMQAFGVPRVGDEIRLIGDRFYKVNLVVWVYDEPECPMQRVNIRVVDVADTDA